MTHAQIPVPPPGHIFVKTKIINGEQVQVVAIQKAAVPTPLAAIAASTSAQVIFDANAERVDADLTNNSEANLYLTVGNPARAPTIVDWDYKLYPEEVYSHDKSPTSEVKGIWDAADGEGRRIEYLLPED